MGLEKDSLMGKVKLCMQEEKNQGIHSLLLIRSQALSHLWESKAPSCLTVTWEDKRPPLPSAISFICSEWHHMVWDIPLFGWAQQSSYGLSQLFVHPQPTCQQGTVRNRKDLVVQTLLSKKYWCNSNTYFVTNPKHCITWGAMRNINSIPS